MILEFLTKYKQLFYFISAGAEALVYVTFETPEQAQQ